MWKSLRYHADFQLGEDRLQNKQIMLSVLLEDKLIKRKNRCRNGYLLMDKLNCLDVLHLIVIEKGFKLWTARFEYFQRTPSRIC